MTDEKEEVTEDIGGVQGSAEDDVEIPQPAPGVTDQSTDVPVPDSGEIEWAGAVVGKAPRKG